MRLLLALATGGPLRADGTGCSSQISVEPASIHLAGPDASTSILVEQKLAARRDSR